METAQKRRRSTVHLRKDLHQALKKQAQSTSSTIADLLDRAVQTALDEDREDLAAFGERAEEPTIPFNEMVKRLNLDGKV